VAVNHPDGGSSPPRDVLDCGRVVNAADCKSVLRQCRFESYQSQEIKGRSIIG
jgi:hypothetical protein